jgi:hypothetical protein
MAWLKQSDRRIETMSSDSIVAWLSLVAFLANRTVTVDTVQHVTNNLLQGLTERGRSDCVRDGVLKLQIYRFQFLISTAADSV